MINYVNSGSPVNGSTSLSVAYPISIVAGNLLVLSIVNKHAPNFPSTPSGWTQLDNSSIVYSASGDAADTGSVCASVFVKEADGTESGNLSVTISSGNTARAIISQYSKTHGDYWDLVCESFNPIFYVAAKVGIALSENNISVKRGDHLLICTALSTDALTLSSQNISIGKSLLSSQDEIENGSTTTGNDCALVVTKTSVLSGDNEKINYSLTATGTVAVTHGISSVVLRMREGSNASSSNTNNVVAQGRKSILAGARTFLGSASTQWVWGSPDYKQCLLIVSNDYNSPVDILIKRLVTQADSLGLVSTTYYMPLVKTFRMLIQDLSNFMKLKKVPFDTSMSSSKYVNIYTGDVNIFEETEIYWQQFTMRTASVVDQRVAWDNNSLPLLVESTNFSISPGEMIVVQISNNNINSNVHNVWFTQVAWEEIWRESISLSGRVTLGGNPVKDAKLTIVSNSDDFSEADIQEIYNTPNNGYWESAIPSGRIGSVFVQYDDGSTKYTDNAMPYLGQ